MELGLGVNPTLSHSVAVPVAWSTDFGYCDTRSRGRR